MSLEAFFILSSTNNILVCISFNIERIKRTQFCDWLKQNEPIMNGRVPQGWTYRGTYSTKFSSAANEYLMLWEITKFQSLDGFPQSGMREFQIAFGEFASFLENKPQWIFYEPAHNIS